jgi:tetratricopeptide (TPR) repeat protein
LEILVEYGYIGLVLFIIIFVRFIVIPGAQRLKNELLRNSTNPNESTLTIGAFGSSLSLFVHLFFDFSLHIPAVMLVLIISTLLVGKELASHPNTQNGIYSAKTSKTIMLLMVTTLSVIGLIGYTRLACEDLYLKRAERRSALGWTRLDNLYSASRVASDNPTTYIQIAEELRGAGNSDKTKQNRMLHGAIMYLSNSISLNPLSPTARMYLGLCYEDLGDLRRAKEHLLEANKIGVNDVNILNSLARVMIANNDVEAARKIVDQSIGVNWWRNIDAYYLKNVIEYSGGGSKR